MLEVGVQKAVVVVVGVGKVGGVCFPFTNQVASVMNRNLNRFYNKCVLPEVKSGGKPGNVKIDLAIAGSGSVMGATVHGGSASFQGCMGNQIKTVRFPTFGAPRMGARYSFTVN